jgi:ssDNA-binding Zn-finger/Zn-ribbon topoisomerase 1
MLGRAELLSSFQRWAKSGPGQITLAVSCMILLITSLVLFGGGAATAKEKGPYQFLECPRCEFRQPYNEMMADKLCFKCRREPLVAKRRSSAEQGGLLPTTGSGKALMFGLVALMVLQVVVYSWITHARSWRPEDDEEWYKIRCPKCRGKMAYPASKSGMSIRCSRCRNEVALPS